MPRGEDAQALVSALIKMLDALNAHRYSKDSQDRADEYSFARGELERRLMEFVDA